jgi:hypothetical protein
MPMNNKSLTQQADRYIEGWQQRQAERGSQTYPFSSLPVGTEFTLPGGLLRQTKIAPGQAQAGSQIIRYQGWEQVVPLAGTELI